MRADRLLSIIWLLRAHGRLSTAELAERLEVSRRTILRDVEALSAAGVPVYCQRGRHGGVRLLPGYRADVTSLSGQESRAIFAATTTWGAEAMGLGEALATALRKLLAAVPEEHRAASAEVAARIVIDPQGWLPLPEGRCVAEVLDVVQRAVFSRHRLRLVHRSGRGSGTRELVVEPYGLVSAGSTWYLCASPDESIRFYRLSRIEEAEALMRPGDQGPDVDSGTSPGTWPDVDVAAQWRAHRDRFQQGLTPVSVTAWVREERRGDAREWAIRAESCEEQQGSPAGPAWSQLRLDFVDHRHALTCLLGLGEDARVISPASVRDALVRHAETILAAYR